MKTVIVLVVIALALGVSAIVNLYYVRDGAGATLFWRGDEAYLFLGTSSSGSHFRSIDYPLVALKEFLNAPLPPNDDRVSSAVIRITPSHVEHYRIEFGAHAWAAPALLTPFDDGFYAMCPGITLCKWKGDRFEPATEEERRRLDGTNRLFHGDIHNQIVNGWSVGQLPRGPLPHFEVEIAGKYSIYAQDRAAKAGEYSRISVNLLFPGQAPQLLYSVDGTPRRVSRTEYESLFPKHQ